MSMLAVRFVGDGIDSVPETVKAILVPCVPAKIINPIVRWIIVPMTGFHTRWAWPDKGQKN